MYSLCDLKNSILHINGEERTVAIAPGDILLDVLRDKLGLTGAKPGCENGDCGTCTILLDGVPVKACLILAAEALHHQITTIEGLKNTIVQAAFVEKAGFQCGYCTSGFILNALAMLHSHPDAEDDTISEWLEANICRCTGYEDIKNAVSYAKERLIKG